MGIRTGHIAAAVVRVGVRMAELEQVLNEADSKLGDGDTGSMLKRVIDRFATVDVESAADVGAAFSLLARAAAASTGSSLGTLFASALMTLGKGAKGREEVAWSDLGPMLKTACEGMSARGGASLGDKTVLDVLDAVAVAIAGLDTRETVVDAALKSGRETLDAFRDKPCRMGRARMFADKSVGLDDPGMLAFVLLMETMTEE